MYVYTFPVVYIQLLSLSKCCELCYVCYSNALTLTAATRWGRSFIPLMVIVDSRLILSVYLYHLRIKSILFCIMAQDVTVVFLCIATE